MQFSNYKAKLISPFPPPGCNDIDLLYFLVRKPRAATQKYYTSSFCLSCHLTFITSCTGTDWHQQGLKTSSDMSRGLADGLSAPDLAVLFPKPCFACLLVSPASRSIYCMLFLASSHFPFFTISSLWWRISFSSPEVAASPVVHSGPAVPLC